MFQSLRDIIGYYHSVVLASTSGEENSFSKQKKINSIAQPIKCGIYNLKAKTSTTSKGLTLQGTCEIIAINSVHIFRQEFPLLALHKLLGLFILTICKSMGMPQVLCSIGLFEAS